MTEHGPYGTACLYPECRDLDDPSSTWCWTGYIDQARVGWDAKPGVAAHVPAFDTDQEAIAWALERTPVVVIHDEDNKPFWAGQGSAPEDVPDLWARRTEL
ncbi:hypothetical protein ACFXJ8_36515 [Nonomuraea sp. NPDC059194]|uniref:hypothetical protein n=1 Tax=Nonomuraea sp. NPDC059194 TaxID=3346764 RepID=UPI003695DFEB